MQNKNRIGLSFSHISNANISNTNPGVEIISLSYQIPYLLINSCCLLTNSKIRLSSTSILFFSML